MAATKTKPEPQAVPAVVTFAEINARKVRERIETYRDIVQRHASGGTVTAADMEQASELLELLGLPQYAFERDVDAVRRAKVASDKMQAAIDARPANIQRAAELAAKIDAIRQQLEALREEHRRAVVLSQKGTAYEHTLRQLATDHPHMLSDLDTAVRLRIEELDRRKQIGGRA